MALLTVENQLAEAINVPDELTGGVGVAALLATGGAKSNPLPFPFSHVELAANGDSGDSLQLPINPGDMRHKAVPWLSHEPREEWNMLVAAGTVTMAFATQADAVDAEELMEAAY
jgi:hypothetical protein